MHTNIGTQTTFMYIDKDNRITKKKTEPQKIKKYSKNSTEPKNIRG